MWGTEGTLSLSTLPLKPIVPVTGAIGIWPIHTTAQVGEDPERVCLSDTKEGNLERGDKETIKPELC